MNGSGNKYWTFGGSWAGGSYNWWRKRVEDEEDDAGPRVVKIS